MHYHIIVCVHKHINDLQEVTKSKMSSQKRTYFYQWPGRGPFSHLPPWQRPGRAYYGTGYRHRRRGVDPQVCAIYPWLPKWWWTDPTYQHPSLTPTSQDELAALEESKKALDEEKANIDQEISDIETKVKELKSKLESETTPSTGQ